MAQHDFNIANQTFPNFRSDLNDALEAAATISAGASAPSTTYAYQLWFNTSSNTLKIRNSANSAWIDFAGIDGSGNISFDNDTLYVDSANNRVGMGTTDPAAYIHIEDPTPTIRLEDTNANGYVQLSANNTRGGLTIQLDPQDVDNNTDLRVQVDGSEVARIDASGLSFDAGSNYLDDYEEGTWTPTAITNSGTAGSIGTASGIYTKVGRLVTIIGEATNITPGGTSTSIFRIDGLPFTPANENSNGSAIWDNITFQGANTRFYLSPQAQTAGYIQFTQCGDDNADTPLDHGDLDAGGASDIKFTVTYMV